MEDILDCWCSFILHIVENVPGLFFCLLTCRLSSCLHWRVVRQAGTPGAMAKANDHALKLHIFKTNPRTNPYKV